MPSSVKANLLDDGVVDTLVSVDVNDLHTSAFINPRAAACREHCQQTRVRQRWLSHGSKPLAATK